MPVLYLCIIALIAAVDQALKYLVVIYVKPVGTVTAVPYLLDLVYAENRGVAFGLFQDARWFFIIVTAAVIVLFGVLLVRYRDRSRMFCIACSLIVGGGIGNLIDRIFRGFVIDYLQLSFFPPVCNFADYCITAGTVVLVIYLLFFYKDKKERSL